MRVFIIKANRLRVLANTLSVLIIAYRHPLCNYFLYCMFYFCLPLMYVIIQSANVNTDCWNKKRISIQYP
jgi:hypothetical protein